MSAQRWWIHLKHATGETSVGFQGTQEDAEKKAAQYIGKVASWDCRKRVHVPNTWDTYTAWRVEAIPERDVESPA